MTNRDSRKSVKTFKIDRCLVKTILANIVCAATVHTFKKKLKTFMAFRLLIFYPLFLLYVVGQLLAVSFIVGYYYYYNYYYVSHISSLKSGKILPNTGLISSSETPRRSEEFTMQCTAGRHHGVLRYQRHSQEDSSMKSPTDVQHVATIDYRPYRLHT